MSEQTKPLEIAEAKRRAAILNYQQRQEEGRRNLREAISKGLLYAQATGNRTFEIRSLNQSYREGTQ